jgi:hypothetical protein
LVPVVVRITGGEIYENPYSETVGLDEAERTSQPNVNSLASRIRFVSSVVALLISYFSILALR